MAVVIIKDEKDIEAYIKSMLVSFPDIKAVIYVDVDTDLEALVKDYFTNKYKGTVLFWGNYEERLSLNAGLTWSTPQLQATILQKYDKQKPNTLIDVRTLTKKLMVKFIHKLRTDREETLELGHGQPGFGPGDSGKHWSFKLHNNMIFPVGDMGGASVRGWSIDFEIGFPLTELV